MNKLLAFKLDVVRQLFRGNKLYWTWMGSLAVIVVLGAMFYVGQLREGMIITGLSDQVSWGAYIANFTYLVGVAAAAVMLVIPAYIFQREDAKHVVLIGEGIAVAAVVMCIAFVTVDLGRPDRIWHMLPYLGKLNFPQSMLAWDVLVLSGYLVLNLLIPFYVLYSRYLGREPNWKLAFPFILLAIAWAVSIHTVTALLFSSNVAGPFWHTAILGPRFLASAFTSGPALIILAFQVIHHNSDFKVPQSVIKMLSLIVTVALQINLFLLGAELFTEFYHPTEHTASAAYLFTGLAGQTALVPWIWGAVSLNLVAVVIFSVHPWRGNQKLMNVACVMAIVGVWIEKGMGLIIPGFVPTPIGEIFEYSPTQDEIMISLGIWALGLMVFTIMVKMALPVELGTLTYATRGDAGRAGNRPAHHGGAGRDSATHTAPHGEGGKE